MTDTLYGIWGSTLTGTANAIRTKKGTSGDIDPANFETEILSIPSGGESNLGTLNVTSNGTYTPTFPLDGWNEVNVEVEGGLNGGIVSHYDFKNEQNLNDIIRDGMSAIENNSSYFSMISDKGLNAISGEGQLNCNLSLLMYEGERADIKIKFGEELNDFNVSRLISFKNVTSDTNSTLYYINGSFWIWYNGVDVVNTGITDNHIFENSELTIQVKCINNKLNYTYIFPDGTSVDANIQQENGAQLFLGQMSYSGNGFKNLIIEDIRTTYVSPNSRDIKFYDYDGTVLFEYIPSEFLTLNSMPTPPTHSGLTSDGWNWSLADAKAYVTNHGKIDVGAMYYWDENYTEVDFTLVDGRLSPYLCFAINGSATVDWGDGSSTETVTGSNINTFIRTQHTYASGGDYTITITPDTGTSIALGNSNNRLLMKNATGNNSDADRPYTHSIKKIRVGKNSILNADCFNTIQNLEFVALPKTITALNTGTFRYCSSLESIAWHNDITSIGQNQFQTTALKFIAFPSSTTTYASSICDNDVVLKNVSLNNTSTFGASMFLNCSSLTHIYIPDSVTVTPDSFCEKCRGLTELELPIGIETFETDSFLNCDGLSGEFNFPSTLTTIGISAFNACYGITKLKFNSSVTLYGSCFRSCDAIKEIIFEGNVEFNGTNQFENCYGLNSITFNGSVTSISNTAFSNCYSIESITLPNTLIALGNYAFSNWDGLREITLPDTITTLGSYLFNSCSSLNKVTLPSNITTIPEKCFSECVNLQEVTIPSGVTTLESGAFYRTYALSNITIPSGVTDMKGECFRYCHSLGYIKFEGSTPPTLNNANCFGALPTDCIIYVPTGSLSAYTSKQYYPNSSTYTYVEY